MDQTWTRIQKNPVKSEFGLTYCIMLIKIQNIQRREINLLNKKFCRTLHLSTIYEIFSIN